MGCELVSGLHGIITRHDESPLRLPLTQLVCHIFNRQFWMMPMQRVVNLLIGQRLSRFLQRLFDDAPEAWRVFRYRATHAEGSIVHLGLHGLPTLVRDELFFKLLINCFPGIDA